MKKHLLTICLSISMMVAWAIPVMATESVPQNDGVEIEEQTGETIDLESGIIDTTAPTISNIQVVGNPSINAPGYLEIVADISDDASGVSSAGISFYCDENEKGISGSFYNTYYDENTYTVIPYSDGKWHAKVELDEYQLPGEYKLSSIYVYDRAGNRYDVSRNNYSNQETTTIPEQYQNMTITVKNELVDTTAPTISNIQIVGNPSINAPGYLEIVADISDDASGVSSAGISFYCDENEKGISGGFYNTYYDENTYTVIPYSDGKWHAKVELDEYLLPGEYKLSSIYVYDRAGNRYDVSRNNYSNQETTTIPEQYQNMTITVKNELVDTTAPTISNIQIVGNPSINVPGYLEIVADISDDASGVSSAWMSFYCDENEKGISGNFYNAYYDYLSGDEKTFSDGKWHASIRCNLYQLPGEYKLSSIYVYDRAGNCYDVSRNNYSNQETTTIPEQYQNMTIIVENDGKGVDVTTGTTSNYIEKISNAPEGAMVSVDYTSNAIISSGLFDAIKGTDKVVLFEGDGYQWSINGKDVTQPSKDIRLSIDNYAVSNGYSNADKSLAEMLNGQNAVVYKFAENGVLPGKMTIRIKADYALREYMGTSGLYVYYYDTESGQLVPIATNISLTKDYYFEFTIEHCSEYIMSKGVISNLNVPQKNYNDINSQVDNSQTIVVANGRKLDSVPKTADRTNYMALIILLIIIGSGIALMGKKVINEKA